MDGVNILKIAFFIVFMTLNPKSECQPILSPRPLCISQFALANHACSMLPLVLSPPPSPPPPPPLPPPSPSNGSEHRHKHGHKHHVDKETPVTPVEEYCCRWLQAVDRECVCDLLLHLPGFLSRPTHTYTLLVDASCKVTFPCGSRLRGLK